MRDLDNTNQGDELSSNNNNFAPSKRMYLIYGTLAGLVSAMFGILVLNPLGNFYLLFFSAAIALVSGSISCLLGELIFNSKLGCIITSFVVSLSVTPILSIFLGFISGMAG
jgi:hypothetical protein